MLYRLLFGLTLISIVALTCPCLSADQPEWELAIQNTYTNKSWSVSLAKVEKISINFFHSYDRQWVEESFVLKNGKLVPVEVVFSTDTYDYRYERYKGQVEVHPKSLVLKQIEPRSQDLLNQITFRVAYTRPQRLVLKGPGKKTVILFTKWGKPGQQIVLSLKKKEDRNGHQVD